MNRTAPYVGRHRWMPAPQPAAAPVDQHRADAVSQELTDTVQRLATVLRSGQPVDDSRRPS